METPCGLVDVTNGSPIVGLATGILKTPSSRSRKCCTSPSSGEALLRGQVMNLLQMVEEEAEIISFRGKRTNFFHLQSGFVGAPTPENTPHMMDVSTNELLPPVTVEDKFVISQILNNMMYKGKKKEESVTRSLLLDFCDKSESSQLDELREAIGTINANGGGLKFVYNSNHEFVGVEEFAAESS